MHSSNAPLWSYAGLGQTTSAVQLEELRNMTPASLILHYPRARQPWVGVLRWALNVRARLSRLPFAALKTGNPTGRVPTKARVYGCSGLQKICSTGPLSTTSPFSRMATRLHREAIESSSCEMRSTAMFISCLSSFSRSITSVRLIASSALVGSSAMRSRGRCITAMAISTRCACPTLSWRG